MKKNISKILIIMVLLFPIRVLASNYLLIGDCNYILGSINDSHSVAYLLQEIFDVFKIAAPVLVLIFTTVDFFKAITDGDKESLPKAAKRLIKRLILVAVLFSAAALINFLFPLL